MPLKILIYCDHHEFEDPYTTDQLECVLREAGFEVGRTRRAKDGARATIDEALLAAYDELWLFLRATDPDDELEAQEREALERWMAKGGGVLITGDHAEVIRRPGGRVYRGLGGPIGHEVPRAGSLRVWDEPPTIGKSHETTGVDAPASNDDPEQDATPQRLLLRRFTGNKPHPIFDSEKLGVLDRLPDHAHEGKVLIPPTLTEAAGWPRGAACPQTIAHCLDWDKGELRECIIVWEDEKTELGRIVADTTWHHYVDPNLKKIATPDNPHWPKLRQYYINLAAWLASPAARRPYIEAALERVNSLSLESSELPIDELHRLLAAALPAPWLQELSGDLAAIYGVRDYLKKWPDFADNLLTSHLRYLARIDASASPGHISEPGVQSDLENAPRALQAALDPLEDALHRYEQDVEARQARLRELREALGRSK
jgi:hypothetical protein